MFNNIWEFLFCPQHGLVIQGWYMVPLVFAALMAHGRQAASYVRKKVDQWKNN